MEKYVIKKVLNNNVIVARDRYNRYYLLIGNGIGFKQKANEFFAAEQKSIQKFEIQNQGNISALNECLKSKDRNVVAIIEEEITSVQKQIPEVLNENIHITLIDHITFALDRSRKGLDFSNPFNQELSILYPDDYQFAKKMVERINQECQAALVEDEVGIIAIHIHAARTNEMLRVAKKKINMCQDTIERLYDALNLHPAKDSPAHQRLLLHIRYAYERVFSDRTLGDHILYAVKEEYPLEFKIIRSLMDDLEQKYAITIPDSEIGYIMLHVNRIRNENNL